MGCVTQNSTSQIIEKNECGGADSEPGQRKVKKYRTEYDGAGSHDQHDLLGFNALEI